ncbi:MAG: hypothetical protein OHK0039_41400 [Bacteroidia bacterium]
MLLSSYHPGALPMGHTVAKTLLISCLLLLWSMQLPVLFAPASGSLLGQPMPPASHEVLHGRYEVRDDLLMLDLFVPQAMTVSVSLRQLSGQLVYAHAWATAACHSTQTLDLAALPAGVYRLEVLTGSRRMSRILVR